MPSQAEKTPNQLNQLPQWFYLAALLLGIPLAGGGGSLLGAQGAAEDMRRLEQKVDKLDEKLSSLELAIVRAHAADPTFRHGGSK